MPGASQRWPILRRLGDERGATAAEFALILAPLIMLTLGVINTGLMVYTVSTLHFAAEDTARWASIQTTTSGTAPGASTIQTQGASVYKGPTPVVTFTANSAAACGFQITGTTTYNVSTGLTSSPVTLSATACYPLG